MFTLLVSGLQKSSFSSGLETIWEVRWGFRSIQSLLPMPPEPQNNSKTHIFKISKLRCEVELNIPRNTYHLAEKLGSAGDAKR